MIVACKHCGTGSSLPTTGKAEDYERRVFKCNKCKKPLFPKKVQTIQPRSAAIKVQSTPEKIVRCNKCAKQNKLPKQATVQDYETKIFSCRKCFCVLHTYIGKDTPVEEYKRRHPNGPAVPHYLYFDRFEFIDDWDEEEEDSRNNYDDFENLMREIDKDQRAGYIANSRELPEYAWVDNTIHERISSGRNVQPERIETQADIDRNKEIDNHLKRKEQRQRAHLFKLVPILFVAWLVVSVLLDDEWSFFHFLTGAFISYYWLHIHPDSGPDG